MSAIIRLVKNLRIKAGMIPSKIVKLETGLTCYHYANGTIDVR